ncbi:acetylxylan esterase [Arthrobacter sp. ok909]|uniref:acetylxylan esterase n=1 Tax=Arthrobacter sp. ok909 TaxID=1761746 RepID=UPI00158758B7
MAAGKHQRLGLGDNTPPADQRAVTITDQDPYAEIARFLKMHCGNVATAMDILAYFDDVFFARRPPHHRRRWHT